MGIYPMAISQSEHDKFPWGRISYNISYFILLFSQIQKEVAMPDTSSSVPEEFSSLCSLE